MFRLSHTLKQIRSVQAQAGFTMIELLIVISILGILAVAVLSAINPVEQINRGRDTGTQSDAEQLISAIDRHHAFQSYYPWQIDANDDDELTALEGALTPVTALEPADTANCSILDKLSIGSTTPACSGTNELKATFITRIVSGGANRTLHIYNRGTTGSSTYVCFIPQSDAYLTRAKERCRAALPGDIEDVVAATICGGVAPGADNTGTAAAGSDYYYCLP